MNRASFLKSFCLLLVAPFVPTEPATSSLPCHGKSPLADLCPSCGGKGRTLSAYGEILPCPQCLACPRCNGTGKIGNWERARFVDTDGYLPDHRYPEAVERPCPRCQPHLQYTVICSGCGHHWQDPLLVADLVECPLCGDGWIADPVWPINAYWREDA